MSIIDKLAVRARRPGQLRVTVKASELLDLIAVAELAIDAVEHGVVADPWEERIDAAFSKLDPA